VGRSWRSRSRRSIAARGADARASWTPQHWKSRRQRLRWHAAPHPPCARRSVSRKRRLPSVPSRRGASGGVRKAEASRAGRSRMPRRVTGSRSRALRRRAASRPGDQDRTHRSGTIVHRSSRERPRPRRVAAPAAADGDGGAVGRVRRAGPLRQN